MAFAAAGILALLAAAQPDAVGEPGVAACADVAMVRPEVRTDRDDDVVADLERRLVGELVGIGCRVSLSRAGDVDARWLPEAVVRARRDGERLIVDLWRPARDSALEERWTLRAKLPGRVGAKAPAALLAVHTAELLRARLAGLELEVTDGATDVEPAIVREAPAPAIPPVAIAAPAQPPVPPEMGRDGARVSIAFVLGRSLSDGAFVPAARAGIGYGFGGWAGALAAQRSLRVTEIEREDNGADVSHGLLLAGAVRSWRAEARLQPFAALSAGAAWWDVVGRPDARHEAAGGARWCATGEAQAGVSARISSRWAWFAAVALAAGAPRVRIQIDGAAAARSANPTWSAMTGVAVAP